MVLSKFQTILESTDDGPELCCLTQTLQKLENKEINMNQILNPMVVDCKYKALELSDLLKKYETFSKTKTLVHSHLIQSSVVEWIYFTNNIEEAGFETKEDTEKALNGSLENADQKKEKEVTQMFSLLKETYTIPKKPTDRIFDLNSLKKWHQTLFKDLLRSAGEFRKTGVTAPNLDKSQHKYPHHSVLKSYLESLSQILWKLSKLIDGNDVCSVVALASFAQFHFVDIHPFADGNGRMCRFICKFILDSIFPLPIPMFKNRNAYIQSLIEGRKCSNSLDSPIELCRLIFDVAINFYRESIKKYENLKFYLPIVVKNEKELKQELEKITIKDKDNEDILKSFSLLKSNQKEKVCIPFSHSGREYDGISVLKYFEIEFDDL
jgi:Fic family protein